jgi:Domain of unknown function (DUF5916)/Carbohydrate family 9 binding domain-like
MKTLCAFLAVLFFTFIIPAQTANLVETKEPETPKKTTSASKSKVIVPPEKARPIKIPKIETPPTIDGKPDEEAWKTAAVFKDFYQTNPGNNIAPSKPTEAYVMYDEKNLYVSFKCWDDKDKIRATVAKRDEVFGEDNVRMWLDTYNDQRRAYVVGFNPLGIQQDGIFTEGQGADFSVDIVMESKGVIEDWGWSVEVKIPFKSLRYAAGKGKMWGFNLARNIDRFNDEFDQWLPDDRDISGFLIKHGKITGLDEVKFERTLEIVPSVTISETGRRKRTIPISTVNANGYDPVFNPTGIRDPGKFTNDPIKKDIGVNLKYTLTPNITLDAAINPDYAEIEADAPVVTANQRFPIFFQEKRPFFLEGKEIFDSPLQPFYSRTIIDPDIAVKLTGKIDKTSFGFLAASDNAPGNYSEDERNDPIISPRINEFVDKNAFFSVLRVKRDFGKNNNIGFFGTARIFPKNRNFVGGFDGTFKLDDSTVMTFQVLGTHSRKNFYSPDSDSSNYKTGNGIGYYWSLDYTKETHGWFLETSGRSSNYRADSGFTRRTNTNTVFGANRISTKSKAKAKLIQISSNQFARYTYDWKGRFQNGFVGANVNLQLQGNTYIYAESGIMREHIYEDEFGAKRIISNNPATSRDGAFFGAADRSATQPYISFNINKNFNKRFSAYGFVGSIINAFDFDFGGGGKYNRVSPAYLAFLRRFATNPNEPYPGLDPGKGWQFDANVGFEYKPTDPLRFSLDYTKSRLKRNDNGEVAFDTNIFSLRSTYQFSRFVYARLRLDYDTLQRNTSGQFLFGWNPSPGTAFYVGYNDTFNYSGFSPYTGQLEPRFERNARTFFIRASYLFRKSF